MFKANKKELSEDKLKELTKLYQQLTRAARSQRLSKSAQESKKPMTHQEAMNYIARQEGFQGDQSLSAKNPPNGQTYSVQKGDSLSGIAKKFQEKVPGLTWMDLAKHNAIKDPNKIEIGQQIKIPSKALNAPEPAGYELPKKKEQQDQTKKQEQAPKQEQQKTERSTESFDDLLSTAADELVTEKHVGEGSLRSLAQQVRTAIDSGSLSVIWPLLQKIQQADGETSGLQKEIVGWIPSFEDLARAYGKAKNYNAKDWNVLPYIESFYGQVDKKGNSIANPLRSLVKRHAPDLSKLGPAANPDNYRTPVKDESRTMNQETQDAISDAASNWPWKK
jgi:LysM repeat protein